MRLGEFSLQSLFGLHYNGRLDVPVEDVVLRSSF